MIPSFSTILRNFFTAASKDLKSPTSTPSGFTLSRCELSISKERFINHLISYGGVTVVTVEVLVVLVLVLVDVLVVVVVDVVVEVDVLVTVVLVVVDVEVLVTVVLVVVDVEVDVVDAVAVVEVVVEDEVVVLGDIPTPSSNVAFLDQSSGSLGVAPWATWRSLTFLRLQSSPEASPMSSNSFFLL